mgnify:CR=1 FL=1
MTNTVDFFTQGFCENYASNFFKNGELRLDLVEKYGSKFGLSKNDLKGNETIFELAQIIFEKQINNNFGGTDPIKKGISQKKNSIFLEDKKIQYGTNDKYSLDVVGREFFDTKNRKLQIIT